MAIRKILVAKEAGDDIKLIFDISTTDGEKNKIANTIYEVLAMYNLDLEVTQYNRGVILINGLNLISFKDNVTSDIINIYTDWFLDNRVSPL